MAIKKAGRPLGSDVRDHIVEILYFLGEGYAYQIAKIYLALYRKLAKRTIYYHLRKGLSTGEFIIKEVKKESGKNSWGDTTEKIYFALGPNARPTMDERVKNHLTSS